MTLIVEFDAADVAAAVARLTPAQRRTLLAGELRTGPGYWPLRTALIDKGLMTTAQRVPVFTAFGRAVQAELQKAGS